METIRIGETRLNTSKIDWNQTREWLQQLGDKFQILLQEKSKLMLETVSKDYVDGLKGQLEKYQFNIEELKHELDEKKTTM